MNRKSAQMSGYPEAEEMVAYLLSVFLTMPYIRLLTRYSSLA